MSSLMKVETLLFERTVACHFLTEKISGGISICISCLTGHWQARRVPSFTSLRVMWPSSVGRMSPPPFRTRTLHWPQVPPPPHAEGTKMFTLASVWRSLPPVGTETALLASSLMLMVTFPDGIKRAFAERMTATRRRTIAVKATTPDKTTPIVNPLLFQAIAARRLSSFILLTCRPEKITSRKNT